MRNVIILGRPRCGKSTLANMIADKYDYQILRVDAIRDTFKVIYPELSIAPNIAMKNKKFQLFLKEYLRKYVGSKSSDKYGVVLEGCETSVKDCNELFNDGNNIIYYLGAIDTTSEELAKKIKENDTEKDWTYTYSLEKLVEYSKEIIENSRVMKEECKKYNIKFIDTCNNRKEILEKILNEIENEIFVTN